MFILFTLQNCAGLPAVMAAKPVTAPGGKILSASTDRASVKMFQYKNGVMEIEKTEGFEFLADKKIERIIYLWDNTNVIITEEDGIYLFPEKLKGAAINHIHLKCGSPESELADCQIRDVFDYARGPERRLYILYSDAVGSGVTECVIASNWSVKSCKTMNKMNSPLKSNYVDQAESDLQGNIWFRYFENEELGVSRLAPNGEWSHFNRDNSELGDSAVRLMAVEKAGQGLPGDNIWFVSDAGLSRLEYGGKKEIWKLYGEKQTFVNKLMRMFGFESYFTDAIMGILAINVLSDSIVVANKYALYHFTGDNINRFIPPTVKDLDNSQISSISYMDGRVNVFIRIPHRKENFVKYFNILELAERKWREIEYWDLMKEYPEEIYVLPLDKTSSLVALYYEYDRLKFALCDYKTFTLKEIQLKKEEAPASAK